MKYRTQITVNFGEVDLAQIVYYPNIFHYSHIAFERFLADTTGVSYPQMLREEKLGFPTVRAEANFIQKLPYGEQVTVAVGVRKVGQKSVDFGYQGYNRQQQLSFEINTTVVAVNMDGFTSIIIPEYYRTIFVQHLLG
jgi:YbgC/YbaW family acyl-CoA thioester hydrolase